MEQEPTPTYHPRSQCRARQYGPTPTGEAAARAEKGPGEIWKNMRKAIQVCIWLLLQINTCKYKQVNLSPRPSPRTVSWRVPRLSGIVRQNEASEAMMSGRVSGRVFIRVSSVVAVRSATERSRWVYKTGREKFLNVLNIYIFIYIYKCRAINVYSYNVIRENIYKA